MSLTGASCAGAAKAGALKAGPLKAGPLKESYANREKCEPEKISAYGFARRRRTALVADSNGDSMESCRAAARKRRPCLDRTGVLGKPVARLEPGAGPDRMRQRK